jgi:hypothetical protein
MSIRAGLAVLLLLCAAPLRADPPQDKPLPGERVGGEWHDPRAIKRIDNRVPSRIGMRVERRTIGRPLMAATSPVTADADNGCARQQDQPSQQAQQGAGDMQAGQMAQTVQTCQGPR